MCQKWNTMVKKTTYRLTNWHILLYLDDTRDGTGTVPYDGVQLVQASSCRDGKRKIDIDSLRH